MKLTARVGLAASIAAGLAVTLNCSSPAPSEDNAGLSADELAEGISPSDVLIAHGYMPVRHRGQQAKIAAKLAAQGKVTADARDLSYRGGPLLQNGKLQLIFWNSTVPQQAELPGYYQTVGNSPYFDWLSEYDTNGMAIKRSNYLGAFVDNAAGAAGSTITNAQIGQELEKLIVAGSVPAPDNDTLYMFHFPPNVSIDLDGQATSCAQFCAYHYTYTRSNGQNVMYGVMPDLGSGQCAGGGCGPNSVFDNTTLVAAHEWIEATTDPAVGINTLSWYNDSYGEIGDICAWTGPGGRIGQYLVQEEWSNKAGACIVTASGGQDGGVDSGGQDSGTDAGDDGGTDAGDDGGTDAGDDGGTDAGGQCSVGNNEVEPNDDVSTADAFGTGICGTLTAGDRDLATFDLARGANYDVVLEASGDATLKLYHVGKNGKLNRVANTSPTEVKHRSSTGGTYVTLVASGSRSAQSYTLTR